MKSLFLGIIAIVLAGIGGLVYRNAIEQRGQVIACPVDAKVCPDGTSVGRIGTSCVFPVCPPPNDTISSLGISFAVPDGFERIDLPESVVAYQLQTASSTTLSRIHIHQYPISASSTALKTIQETALGDASGLPVSATAYSSTTLGTHRFTVVRIGRFEGVVTTAYYLARTNDVLRFDAIDSEVLDWTSPDLDINTLPAHQGLRSFLSTLSGI
jgi:hypothetical protein